MDLEFILDEMEITAEPFALCELHGRIDLELGKDPGATLHYVLGGSGDITIPGRPPITVSRGSLALIPGLRNHRLRSFGEVVQPEPECHPAQLGLRHILLGDPEAVADGGLLAICAHVSIGLRRLHNLINLVRSPIAEKAVAGGALMAPIEAILHELSSPGPGSRAVVRAHLRVLMVELMRCRLAKGDGGLAWMKALRDPHLWPVLRLMLDKPGEPHSVESLAEKAGLSRSAFARRFAEAYGAGPMEMLRDVRMQAAATMLHESDFPVKRIAEIVGFRSRSSFTRAFEASIGCSPNAFRLVAQGS